MRPDVREAMTALLALPFPTPDDVDWAAFEHFYGRADDVPALLRGLLDPDPETTERSLATLGNRVCHQGGSSAPAALAVPFLIRAAAGPGVHGREGLLLLAAQAVRSDRSRQALRSDLLRVADDGDSFGGPSPEAARAAVLAGVPSLLPLLGDAAPGNRSAAAYALATVPPAGSPEAAAALRGRLAVEADPAVRISLVLAVAQLALDHGDAAEVVAWAGDLCGGEVHPLDVRFAAVLAWLCATPAAPPEPLLRLLLAGAEEAESWMRRVPWMSQQLDHGMGTWLVALLGDTHEFPLRPDPVGRPAAEGREVAGRFTAALMTHDDPAVVVSACEAAARQVRMWRDGTGAMLELLAECLHHPSRTVRSAVGSRLARCGAVPDRVADRVAAVLDHDDDPELRGWAALTLAHRGDARAVAPLIDLLTAGTCALPEGWIWMDRTPQRLLDLLRPHAAALLPAVVHRLTAGDVDGWRHVRQDLVAGLSSWREEAAGAAEALARLLGDAEFDRTAGHASGHKAVATALGRIGPAAGVAVPALDRLAAGVAVPALDRLAAGVAPAALDRLGAGVAVPALDRFADGVAPDSLGALLWARWRITGEETTATAAALARLAAVPLADVTALSLLADMGPAAAGHEAVIRGRLTDSFEWARAEAANALWRCTADASSALPVLTGLVDGVPWAPLFGAGHGTVVGCLADIGPAAAPVVPAMVAFLDRDRRPGTNGPRHDPVSWDQHAVATVRSAVHRIRGGPAPREVLTAAGGG
ncbi:HEAT repeat domain-containing protein [Dactylosporangium sp. NPDC050588]|uniref:HEAT repeat domain-containing protein n=1 Tax=Dactylosporangium sp. NPDC050588 TaxID=3157211 RepID=UPI0034036E0A